LVVRRAAPRAVGICGVKGAWLGVSYRQTVRASQLNRSSITDLDVGGELNELYSCLSVMPPPTRTVRLGPETAVTAVGDAIV